MSTIYHLTSRDEWEQARAAGVYTPESLHAEGFIHLSTTAQIVGVANNFYRGRAELVLLAVDTDRLTASLKWEAPAHPVGVPVVTPPSSEQFPHLYGPLNVDAVARVHDFPADADGAFTLPDDLA